MRPHHIVFVMIVIAGLVGVSVSDTRTPRDPEFEVSWYTIDGGGGTSAGGPFTLMGTIGQLDGGTVAGGDFELKGGFWRGGMLNPISVPEDDPSGSELPRVFCVYPPRPNPFNPSTAVTFDLPAPNKVHMGVYNVLGRLVAVLVDSHVPAGRHTVRWDGFDRVGEPVASGVYILRTTAGDWSNGQKLLLLK